MVSVLIAIPIILLDSLLPEPFFEGGLFDKGTSHMLHLMSIYIPTVLSLFLMYLYAKLFGVFKYIDKLRIKLYFKLLNIFLIAVLLFVLLHLSALFWETNQRLDSLFNSFASCFAQNAYYKWHCLALPFSFLLYKCFQYLTKKYPYPFEKIGYYCSIEFYKNVLRKVYFKLKNKFVNK